MPHSPRRGRPQPSLEGFPSIAGALERWPGVRLLDVRPAEDFRRGHARGAGHIPASEFELRRMELPSREEPVLAIAGAAGEARDAALALAAREFVTVGWLAVPVAADPLGLVSQEPSARLGSAGAFLEHEHVRAHEGRALDLACGTGRATVFLASRGFRAEGWDVDASALDRAARSRSAPASPRRSARWIWSATRCRRS